MFSKLHARFGTAIEITCALVMQLHWFNSVVYPVHGKVCRNFEDRPSVVPLYFYDCDRPDKYWLVFGYYLNTDSKDYHIVLYDDKDASSRSETGCDCLLSEIRFQELSDKHLILDSENDVKLLCLQANQSLNDIKELIEMRRSGSSFDKKSTNCQEDLTQKGNDELPNFCNNNENSVYENIITKSVDETEIDLNDVFYSLTKSCNKEEESKFIDSNNVEEKLNNTEFEPKVNNSISDLENVNPNPAIKFGSGPIKKR